MWRYNNLIAVVKLPLPLLLLHVSYQIKNERKLMEEIFESSNDNNDSLDEFPCENSIMDMQWPDGLNANQMNKGYWGNQVRARVSEKKNEHYLGPHSPTHEVSQEMIIQWTDSIAARIGNWTWRGRKKRRIGSQVLQGQKNTHKTN